MVTEQQPGVVKALEKIEKAISHLEKAIAPKPVRHIPVSTHSGVLIGQVDAELDWLSPAIKIEISFIKSADGRITITGVIEGEDAAIAEDILQSVDYLQVSSVPL